MHPTSTPTGDSAADQSPGAPGESWVDRLRQRGGHLAVVEADTGQEVSGRDLAEGIAAEAIRWRRRYPHGATVALSGFNGIPWLQAALGVTTAGCVAATVNPLGAATEIAQQLRRCHAQTLVADRSVADRLNDDLTAAEIAVETLGSATTPSSGGQDAAAAAPALPPQRPDDVTLLMTSSGTTGAPKTARLTRGALEASARPLTEAWQLTEDDVVLGVLPFSHAAGLAHALTAVRVGASLVTLPRFEPSAFLTALHDHRVSAVLLAPPILRLLATHPAVDDLDLSALRIIASAGAPLPAALQTACAQRLDIPVCNAYGMTETGWIAMGSIAEPNPPGTVGRVLPEVELRLIDPATGTDAAPDTPGELWVRGPATSPGYLDDPDATAALITPDGWSRTGDLGVRDPDGMIRIVDRLKDLIKYKGNQVAPAELELLLAGRDDIADVAVAADPDPEAGEIPRAYVVARRSIDPDELMAWVAERVSPHKRVRAITFVDEIPRLPAGKILRHLLGHSQ